MDTRVNRCVTAHQQDTLEKLVDACGLDLVLGSLANICAEKAAHVRHNWQDEKLARQWLKAMQRCNATACSKAVIAVS